MKWARTMKNNAGEEQELVFFLMEICLIPMDAEEGSRTYLDPSTKWKAYIF